MMIKYVLRRRERSYSLLQQRDFVEKNHNTRTDILRPKNLGRNTDQI